MVPTADRAFVGDVAESDPVVEETQSEEEIEGVPEEPLKGLVSAFVVEVSDRCPECVHVRDSGARILPVAREVIGVVGGEAMVEVGLAVGRGLGGDESLYAVGADED